MNFAEFLKTPGEHSLTLPGVVGTLEAHLSIPESINSPFVALLGHPHSLQGGTMNNKVVTTMARAFKELGIPALRFNFRGVMQSEGDYDSGIGESEDMVALAKMWCKEDANVQFIFAGFSFGSYVVCRAATQFQESLLITIAPAVHNYDYLALTPSVSDWLLVQGDEDEVVPLDLVREFVHYANNPIHYVEMAQTSHFFHGKLIELKSHVLNFLKPKI